LYTVKRRWISRTLLIAAGFAVLWTAWPRLFPDPLAAGRAAYEQRAWARAGAEARKRLRDRPDDREAWRLLARSEGRQGRDRPAQAIFRQRLGLDAMTAEDDVIAAAGLMRGGQPAQARIALEKARSREPDHAEMLHDLAKLNAATGRLDEAAELAERLVARPGWEYRGWLMLGQVREELDDPAGTADALRQALRLDPSLAGAPFSVATARKRLARALLRTARPAEAREQVTSVLARGRDLEAAWLLSRALLQQGEIAAASSALAQSEKFGDRDPTRPEPAPLVGATRCAECHATLSRDQQSSPHAHTFYRADEPETLPSFDRPVVDGGDARVRHVLRREGSHLEWETTDRDKLMRAVVEYAFGSGDVAVTLVGHDAAGAPRELRLSHYGRGAVWDVTTGHLMPPEDRSEYLGRPLGRDGIRRCMECHTTSARASAERSGPTAADRGITCERCHGPGTNHLAAIAARFPDPAIARPRLASAEQVMALCAACHSPKDLKLAPGDHLAPRFASPSLAWSRCYTESGGGLSCVTCHDPHRKVETSASYYENRCLACHAKNPTTPSLPARELSRLSEPLRKMRRIPCPVEPAKGCLKCHMPAVEGIVPHASFTDHRIRVRTQATGSR
jgi:tetratricopeptide (TPR) repeat protein